MELNGLWGSGATGRGLPSIYSYRSCPLLGQLSLGPGEMVLEEVSWGKPVDYLSQRTREGNMAILLWEIVLSSFSSLPPTLPRQYFLSTS